MTDNIVISNENNLQSTNINAIYQRSHPYIAIMIFVLCSCYYM